MSIRTSRKQIAVETLEMDGSPAVLMADLSPAEGLEPTAFIQPHGALLVFRESDLCLSFASANAESILGASPESMLGSPLEHCLGTDICDAIVRSGDDRRLIFDTPPYISDDELMEDSPSGSRLREGLDGGGRRHFDVRRYNDLIYIEVQPESLPGCTPQTCEEHAHHLPIKVQMLIDALRAAGSLKELLRCAATKLRSLTGYDRVMVYQFVKDGHGYVAAEECAEGMTPVLDLHYPAADVPEQARSRNLLESMEVVADTRSEAVPVLADPALSPADLPLDMSHCGLRSPLGLRPLEQRRQTNSQRWNGDAFLSPNQEVGATLTLSLVTNGQLWGLIVFQHREPRLPSPGLRAGCDLLGQMISSLIDQRIKADALAEKSSRQQSMREIEASFAEERSVFDGLVAAQQQVLAIVGATGALLRFGGRQQCIGVTPPLDDAEDLMTTLRLLGSEKMLCFDRLSESMPDRESLRETASGVMLMSTLSVPEEGILWFRPEVEATMKWAADPDEPDGAGEAHLFTRSSIEVWKTRVEGRSLPWRGFEVAAAGKLKHLISTYRLTQIESAFSVSRLVDGLTSLPNRRYFQEKVRLWADRKDLYPAAVILINLDRFRLVNEALGHASGDDLLLQVARRLSGQLAGFGSEHVLFARLGGDEFAAFCPGMNTADADIIADKISKALTMPFRVFGKPFRITASLGVAHASHGGEEELLWAADTAMHFAKRSGRNRSMAFNKMLQSTAIKSLELEQDLYRALENKEFGLVYQPLVTLPDGQLFGFEALLRWHHPVKGTISPLDFIPLAEETGLIVPIGEWVLTEAMAKIKEWKHTSGLPLTIHVNVAAQQLVTPELVELVRRLLREQGVTHDSLSIEVTESVLMRDLAVEALRDLRELGVRVSVDDFGTGYSSLSYLRKLPVDVVKIDQSFVRPIASDQRSRDFFAIILKLTQTLGLEAIAEGVETEEQRQALAEVGCRRAQGYLFSRPLAPAAVDALIARGKTTNWLIHS